MSNLSLKDSRIFINDNLCPYYKGMFGKCRLLQLDGCIHSFWSWKGSIFYKLTENGRKIKVTHEEDLFSKFNDFDFTKRRSVEIEVSEIIWNYLFKRFLLTFVFSCSKKYKSTPLFSSRHFYFFLVLVMHFTLKMAATFRTSVGIGTNLTN